MPRVPAALLVVCLVAACTGPGATRTGPTPAPSPDAVVSSAVAAPSPDPTPAPSAVPGLVLGGDVSWPNCPLGTPGALPERQAKGLPFPAGRARFVVIGLTNGPGFYPNPCLAWEVREAKRRGLATAAYAFTTMPNASQVEAFGRSGPWSSRTRLGRVQNAAYEEALVNIRSIRASGLRTPIVWIDVEPQDYLEPWGSDVVANRAVIRANQRAYAAAGFRTGLYSSDNPWKRITGGLRDSGPAWVTVGPRGMATVQAKCAGPTFSGGPALMAQWWDDQVRDKDLLCPGARLDELFAAP